MTEGAGLSDSQRSLTHAEAEERAALIAVRRYDIDVDMTDVAEGTEVRCTSTVSFTCSSPGASTFVDCCAEVVTATLNGTPLPPAEQSRITLDDLRAENVLVVQSVQSRTTDGEGVHKAVDPADGEVYLWMSFEPDEARQVWACFDQPDLKAEHAFTVTAPASWTVVSNSGGPQTEDLDGARRWTFPATPPLSTYNPVVLAGPFHEIRRSVGGHDLGIFARRSLAAILERDAEEIFTITAQGLAFFADAFDMPFPQEKYDQVFVPELGGAMENFGCVTWSDSYLTRVPPTPAEQELLAAVGLHEMAHMWFGNIVTMRWWDDLWLNEAFAEFAANWALVRATRHTDAWARHLAYDKQQAYLADQGPRSHPIRQAVPDVAAAAATFDAITYPKGASVLDQLMTYIGEDTFRRGMASYFGKFAWGNTTLQDLVDELAAASGRDLDTWRAKWLEEAGVDLLVLEKAADADGFELVAIPAPGTSSPRPHVVGVGAYRRTSEGLERIGFERVEVIGDRTPVDLPEGAELYLADDDDLTFARTRPDADSREALFELAPQLPTAISRGVAVSTVRDMLVSGEARALEVVDCLVRVIRTETSPTCVEPYLGFATRVAELWTPEADRQAVGRLVADLSAELVEQGRYEQVALRSWARTASLDDIARLDAAAAADTDLRWRVLVRRAELGDVPDDDLLERLVDEDPDPDAWVRALTVRTASASEEAKEHAWTTLVSDRKVPISSVGAVATAFWRPGQQDLLAPYAERYVEVVPTLHHGGMISAMVYAGVLFPVFGIDAAYLDRAVEASRQAVPVVQARLEERADEVRRMLVTRSL